MFEWDTLRVATGNPKSAGQSAPDYLGAFLRGRPPF